MWHKCHWEFPCACISMNIIVYRLPSTHLKMCVCCCCTVTTGGGDRRDRQRRETQERRSQRGKRRRQGERWDDITAGRWGNVCDTEVKQIEQTVASLIDRASAASAQNTITVTKPTDLKTENIVSSCSLILQAGREQVETQRGAL